MKINKNIILFLIFCLPLFTIVNAQGNSKKKQQQKKVEQMKMKRDQEALDKYQKAVKRHHKIQSKDTRKRMKYSLNESKGVSPGHKDFFIKRWFKHKKK